MALAVRALLDTSVLIDPPERVRREVRRYRSSVICRAELAWGVRAAGARDRTVRERTLRLYDLANIWLDFGIEASQSFAEAAATAKGSRPGVVRSKDGLIAAHALSLGLPVMTRNAKDFLPFGATIVDPDER